MRELKKIFSKPSLIFAFSTVPLMDVRDAFPLQEGLKASGDQQFRIINDTHEDVTEDIEEGINISNIAEVA